MPPKNATLVNFAAGETSPKSRGRFDLPWYNASCEKLLNFIPEIQGPARFRDGFRRASQTRGGLPARLVPFPVNKDLSYMLEFTNQGVRVFKDDALLTTELFAVTSIGGSVGVASTVGLANGDEVIITGLVGTLGLNDVVFKVASVTGTTFTLTDPFTNGVFTLSNFGTWVSGGTVHKVTVIATPYRTVDLPALQWASSDNTLEITSPRWQPREIAVGASDTFVISTPARTTDPFIAAPAITLTGVSLGTVTFIKFAAGTEIVYDAVYDFAAVGGTTQLNGNSYRITKNRHGASIPVGYDGVSWGVIESDDAVPTDSTAFGAWTAGGTATQQKDCPIAVAFYEGRKVFLGTNRRVSTMFFSRGPNTTTGASQYNDFTGGANANDAAFFTLSPLSGQVDYISWGRATADFLYVGTFGGLFKVSGGGLDTPITPTSVNVKQIDSFGCEPTIPAGGTRVFYVQRGGVTARSVALNLDTISPESEDMMINAEQIAYSPIKRVVLQSGRSDIMWAYREDGQLVGLTVHGTENVTGWHRHKIGRDVGTSLNGLFQESGKFTDVQVQTRPTSADQLWAVTSRTSGASTRYYVEFMTDTPDFQDRDDFFEVVADSASGDLERHRGSTYRRQQEYVHLDTSVTYDGSARGVTAGAYVQIAEGIMEAGVVGTSYQIFIVDEATIAITTFIQAADVGRELWIKPDRLTGKRGGRFLITADNGSGAITGKLLEVFKDVDRPTGTGNPYYSPPGDWYLTTTTVYGLLYFMGIPLRVSADGAAVSVGNAWNANTDQTQASGIGAVNLPAAAAVVHVGTAYTGFLKTQNLELGGQTGPAQAKPRNIAEVNLRFLSALGTDYGTNLYEMDKLYFHEDGMAMDRPTPVFSGIKKVPLTDTWSAEGEKHVYIKQALPLPCIIESIDVVYETGDDG